MCGICGVLSLGGPLDLSPETHRRMIGVMRHRGPDEFGAWGDDEIFLGHARLSIIDLESGQQPMAAADNRYWITFNGEIFNYVELKAELEALGHRFKTHSDTEVILRAHIQWRDRCVEHFNGQFAFAIWDRREHRLFMARDRFGIRPLFLAEHDGKLLFGSEIKSLRAYPGFCPPVSGAAVSEVFSYWVNIAPNTVFEGVAQLPPGCTAEYVAGRTNQGTDPLLPSSLKVNRYWQPTFLPADEDRRFVSQRETETLARTLRDKLVDAAKIRLRADVPVGAYLSGGLDSSTTTALIHHYTDHRLKTFSVGFADKEFDETAWQLAMANHIGTEHATVQVSGEEIAEMFREVVWLTESPILRTAPAPLYALSRLARKEGFKVVLTGEGADEVFAGYNIFRETKVRNFWSRDPGATNRALLLTRLYPYLAQSPPEFLRRFYGKGLTDTGDEFYSHRPRWQNTSALVNFLDPDSMPATNAQTAEERLSSNLPADFAHWGPVARAQYLEMTTFMAGYLLNSQGDRMLMGNSVEGRFPFLDHNLAEFAGSLPASVKLQSLVEKSILKQSVADLLPSSILDRPKQPYRAPDSTSFQGTAGQQLVDQFFTNGSADGGLLQQKRIAALTRKWQSGRMTSARDNMAFVGMLSTRILAHDFGQDAEHRISRDTLKENELIWR
jgi:asparagine synthase (glutamine-hydrolysing)